MSNSPMLPGLGGSDSSVDNTTPNVGLTVPSDTTASDSSKKSGLTRLKKASLILQAIGGGADAIAAASGNMKPELNDEAQRQQQFQNTRQTNLDQQAANQRQIDNTERMNNDAAANLQHQQTFQENANKLRDYQTPQQIRDAALAQKQAEQNITEKPEIVNNAMGQVETVDPRKGIATPVYEASQQQDMSKLTPPPVVGDLFKGKAPVINTVPVNAQPMQTKQPTETKAFRDPDGKNYDYLVNSQTGAKLSKIGLSATQPHENAPPGSIVDAEDEQGNPIHINNKTGQRVTMPGVVPKGTAAKKQAEYDKNIAGPQADMDYATNYLKNGTYQHPDGSPIYTGSGDEAIMEKYFDLAKPMTGFRMSQPQIDMLKNAQSWMSSIQGKAYHYAYGTWFSPQQRTDIITTMQQLADAKKGVARGPAGSGGAGVANAPANTSANVPATSVKDWLNKGKPGATPKRTP